MPSRALLRAGPPPSDDEDDEPRDARPVKRRRMAPEAQPLGQRLQLAEAADDSDPSSDDEDDDGGEEGEEDEDEEEDDPRAAFRDVPLGDLAEAYLDALASLDGDRLGSISAFVAVASIDVVLR